ncbi:MAG: hypothetical protein LBH25_10475 [Fibromonadaceae bacterium]|jgi:uncharacterized protein (TIGR02145 family)|nr:hypothetical protein [Fibromonadaceae bacterium]
METKLNSKGKRFFAPAITAGLVLAMAFTLNACGGDGGDDAPASSSSGGGSPSSSSQPAHEHAYGDWSVTTAPTCEAAGVKTRTCAGDNSHKDTEEIVKLSWEEWMVKTPATPTAAGVETRTCPGNASPAQTRLLYPKCNGVEYDPADGKFLCDERDGKRYKYVDINGQIWMAENLNHKVDGSKCGSVLSGSGTLSDADAAACDKYGRLYNWATAMGGAASSTANPSGVQGVCPSGWHLPSGAEWNALMKFANPSCSDNAICAGAGTKLKSTSGWNAHATYGDGTDDYSFSALPGGSGNSGVNFSNVGYRGIWWSSSENNGNIAYIRIKSYNNENANWNPFVKSDLLSVRCLQD